VFQNAIAAMAAAEAAKAIPFRDRFAEGAFNAFPIRRPIYVLQGAGRLCAATYAS
jgi:hypothetical protein